MTDVIFLLASISFVLLSLAYISWCDRIITDPGGDLDVASTLLAGDPQ